MVGDLGRSSFGLVSEREEVEGWVIVTAPHPGRGDSAVGECRCLLLRCRRDPSKQPGAP